MTNKDMIFFGENGITSTRANHIANIAKELTHQLETELAEISFLDRSVSLIGSKEKHYLNIGNKNVNFVPTHLHNIAKYKSLIAWLREAIKAKDRLIKGIKNLSFQEYCDLKGVQLPAAPENPREYTEDEYIATLSIKDRNRYYYLDTVCAVIGKAIHPEGIYSQARKELFKKLNNPYYLDGAGRDSNIYQCEASVPVKDVDEVFFNLQNQYREYQAQLNGIKHSIQDAVLKENTKRASLYNEELDKYSSERNILKSQLTCYINDKLKEILEYKIVIPNDLLSVYEEVKKVGKQS